MKLPQHIDQRKRALDLLLEITVLLHRDATLDLGKRGLTPARAAVLWHVRGSGPCVQRQLADVLDVSPRNVTGLVDRLVLDGFVTREPHPWDRRAFLVTLTKRGRSVVTSLEREQEKFVSSLFGDMTNRKLTDLVGSLSSVVERLQELGLGAGWANE